jgi:aminoglycoside phosphotransferase (APT) family kinase protein
VTRSGGEGASAGLVARAPRAGEELDPAALARFLAAHVPALADVTPGAITVQQFPGGHSNLTYLLRIAAANGERELVLRRPPFGNKVKSAHDMTREARFLRAIAPAYPRVPAVVALTDDESWLGCPFFVMEPLRGAIFRRAPPAGVTITPDVARTLSEVTVDGLVELHAVPLSPEIAALGKPEGFVERQVKGWSERWEKSKTDEIPDVPPVMEWLARNLPASPAPTIVHNDWKLDNMVLEPSDLRRIVGVLDWEMATIGDPLMDVGTMLSYWVQANDSDEQQFFTFGPTNAPGALTRREAAARYAEKSGRSVANIVFYYAFACFKTAVVAQQIYARYKRGLTKDERFAMMIVGVKVLSAAARRAIETGEI